MLFNNLSLVTIVKIVILVILIVLSIIFYPEIKKLFTDNFNGSGYGMRSSFGKVNTLIPFNEVSKSTDFKLFSLMSQLKYSIIKNPALYEVTKTNEGIITRTPKHNSNVILFPGLTDYTLKQNGREVWPRQFYNIRNSEKATVFNNNEGHFNTITTLLENLNYKEGDKYNTIKYDFRNINFDEIFKQFYKLLKPNTVIIAYDFGCVIANMLINNLKKLNENGNASNGSKNEMSQNNNTSIKSKELIKKFILICPTIGGTPMTLRDYFSGTCDVSPKIFESYDSILMSMPHKTFYKKPVVIYNSLSYDANSINELMKVENKPVNKYENFVKVQEMSFENPEVDCIIVANDQLDTPVAYNYLNNLSMPPERYYKKNNNQTPETISALSSDTVEGIQTKGDGIVPISSILQLEKMWNKQNNVQLELIRDKDHFTILKSYELALILLSNL